MKGFTKRVRASRIILVMFLMTLLLVTFAPVALAEGEAGTNTISSNQVHSEVREGEDPEVVERWDKIINFILPWIARLGGVIILIGAIEFGLAWKDNDAEGKTKGMRTIIAGCIVTAVGASADLFLL